MSSAVAILLIVLLLRKELLGPQPLQGLDDQGAGGRRARLSRRLLTIDIVGQLLFLFGIGLVILALTWAGAEYEWNTAYVLAPLIVGAVLCGLFFCWERLMGPNHALARRWPWQKPMLSWDLVTNKDMGQF